MTLLEEKIGELQKTAKELDEKVKEEHTAIENTKKNIKTIRDNMTEQIKLRKASAVLKPMYENTSGRKLAFKDYVLESFFKNIIAHASDYFSLLMDGRYTLDAKRQETKANNDDTMRKYEIIVKDANGAESKTALLSGGQTFEASLALALGLSEVVQMQRGGNVHIDSMFIDEGFGTLDGQRLERSMQVLNSMTQQNRQIGIISHVEKLTNAEQYKKLEVTNINGVSTVSFSDNS